MTIALVGTPTVSTNGADASRTVGTGNLLVVFCSWEDSENLPSACTVGGASADACTGVTNTTPYWTGAKIFYFPNTVSGSKTISVTWGSGDAVPGWVALEFSGVATSSPLEVQSVLAGYAVYPTTTNSTATTTANSVLVAVIKNYSGELTNPNTSPSTWNEAYDGGTSSIYGTQVQYLVVSSNGIFQADNSGFPSERLFASALATFKAAESAGSIVPLLMRQYRARRQ